MMKRIGTAASILLCVLSLCAQPKDFSFKFYGRIKADVFYNSRASNELVDGLFYLYPKDHAYDSDGKDLNAVPEGSFYSMLTRMGVDIGGPMLGEAKTSAKIEFDFRGSGSTLSVLRLRHAYVNLDWGRSELLIGQTWHPLFGEVSPSVISLCTGAPFQPFNRSPLIRWRQHFSDGWQTTLAAIWQMQYTSFGPEGKSHVYMKNSCLPELFASIDYKTSKVLVGVGAELLSIKPRQQSVVGDNVYKVNERITSASVEAHVKYTDHNWLLSAKSVYANNLTHATMLGGYGVTSVDPRTGEKKYTPFRHSMTWVNIVYGKKWQPGVFFGYLKNLGTGKAITGEKIGVGLDVDQLFASFWQISYNLPYWKLGVEFATSTAWFGKTDNSNGGIIDSHAVTNLRVTCSVMFIF